MNIQPNKHKNNKKIGSLTALSVAIFLHSLLASALLYGSLNNSEITMSDGDNTIKAIMIDMSLIAAPELSLVEDSVAEPKPEEAVDKEPEVAEPVTEQVEVPQEPIVETVIPPVKPIVKPEPKPKPPRQRAPSSSQTRQDVSAVNKSEVATAAQTSANTLYSATPQPINRRQPEYPRRALNLRIEGRVVVLYDIDEQGKVTNIRILEATPSNIFNRSVMSAMKQWHYERKPAQNLKITIMFNRDKSISLE